MIQADLYTKKPDAGYVATVVMPPFNPMPEIVTWGCRSFMFDPVDGNYYEGFNYLVVEVGTNGGRENGDIDNG